MVFLIVAPFLKLNQPIKYMAHNTLITIQIATNNSLFKKPHCFTRSALERNLNAKANSMNPNTTFTTSNQLPDLGNDFNKLGKRANKANGMPNPSPKPENAGMIRFTFFKFPRTNPKIGPVQEKDTIANVNAIKKIPIKLPASLLLSILVAILEGIEIS